MKSRYSHSFTVTREEVDIQGHVNNVMYLKWVQDVAVAHWLSVAGEDVQEKFTWFVTRHEIDYKREAFEGDELTATTWVGERTRITWDRHTEITRNGQLVAQARTVWCLLSKESMRPVRIGDQVVELLTDA